MRDEILLDTGGACFLCLKKDSSRENKGSGDDCNGKTQICLRHICRFLDIKPLMVLNQSFKDIELYVEDKNDPVFTKDLCDFSVMLCVRCTAHVEKLSNLIQEMEVLQLLIRNELQVFQGTLDGSMSRWEQVQEEMISCDSDPEKIRTVEHLRHLAKEKGYLKSKQLDAQSVPRVVLNCVKVPSREGRVNNKDLQSKRHRGDTDDLSNNEGENGGNETDTSCDSEQEDLSPPTSAFPVDPDFSPTSPQSSNSFCKKNDQPSTSGHSPVKNRRLKKPHIFSKELRENFHEVTATNNQSQCSLCNKILTSHSKDRHLVSFHPELLFPTPLSISKDTVRDHCKQILLSKTKRSNSLAQERLKASENWKESMTSFCFCHLCNRFFQRNVNFKWPFVTNHYSICLKKLNVSLGITSSSDDDIKLNVHEYRGSRRPYVCEISNGGCGKGFLSDLVLLKHMKVECIFRKKGPDYICRKEDGGCGRKCASENNLTRHKQFTCPKGNEKYTFICKLEDGGCGKKLSCKFAYHRHVRERCKVLVNKPRKKMVRKTTALMASSQPTKKTKNAKKKNLVPIVADQNFYPSSSLCKMEVEENSGVLEPQVQFLGIGKSENFEKVDGLVFEGFDDFLECALDIEGDMIEGGGVKQEETEGIFPDI